MLEYSNFFFLFFYFKTTVICSLYHAQKNDKYWPHAQEFRPERWIENEDQGEGNDLEAFFTFSAG